MFRAEEIGRLDRSYFNIILAEEYDVTLQSKNTGHIWYIHNPEYPGEGECIIFHKHRASQPYHKHGRARSLGQAVRSIIGHESNVPRHPEEGGCGTLCVCGLFVCEAEVS